jgi:hypothetical protein
LGEDGLFYRRKYTGKLKTQKYIVQKLTASCGRIDGLPNQMALHSVMAHKQGIRGVYDEM